MLIPEESRAAVEWLEAQRRDWPAPGSVIMQPLITIKEDRMCADSCRCHILPGMTEPPSVETVDAWVHGSRRVWEKGEFKEHVARHRGYHEANGHQNTLIEEDRS